MPLFTKEVIRCGDYWYEDEATGMPRKLHVTPEHIQYWHDTGKEMLSAGLSIPVPLEHDTTNKPQTPAEKAASKLLNNAGWVTNYAIDKDGILQSVVDIPDVSLAAKLPKTIRFTSPWFSSFTDGNGRKWNGVISHLALTSRPRITKQAPFGELSAAMSYAVAISPTTVAFPSLPDGTGLTLSRAGLLVPGEGATLVPAYPMAFSLWSGARLALEDMPPKKKRKVVEEEVSPNTPEEAGRAPDKPGGGGSKDSLSPEGALPPLEKSLIDADGDISVYDVLCDLLSSIGMPLPEGTTKDNFLQRIYESAMDRIKGLGATAAAGPGAAATPERPGSPPANPIMQESAPMYMSLEEIAKITDPSQKKMAEAMLSMQNEAAESKKRSAALEKNAVTAATVKRDRRIEAVTRNWQAAQRDQLVKMAAEAKLSLADDGNVIDPLSGMLDLLEASNKQLPQLLLSPASLSVTEQAHPQDYMGGISEERRQEIVKELEKHGGIPQRKTA